MDYISNYILMPVVSIATCIFVGWVVKPKTIIEEVTLGGRKFGREKLYVVMIRYIVPVLLLILLLLICTAYLVDGSFNPFLYFRF